jgi:hypothetical protein
MTGNKEVITGSDFKRMITGAYSEFLLEYENINQLNATSLSDSGVPGTNILRTMGAAVLPLADKRNESIGGLSRSVANAAILGARGNAGVILSQIFRGLAKGLAGKKDVTSSAFGKSFQYGILYAQRTIPDEQERPIIMVAKAVAKGAYNAVRANLPISEILIVAIQSGEKAMEKIAKPDSAADAGAVAMLVFLKGCLRGLDGNFVSPALSFSPGFRMAAQKLPDPHKDIVRPYCLTLTAEDSKAKPAEVETLLQEYGNLVVVMKQNHDLQIHLHTDHPGLVLEQAVGWGSLQDIKLDNMAEPHESRILDKTPAAVVVLAVAEDQDMAEELQNLGANVIVEGNEGASPSVGDFINAVHSDLAERYIILPNSKSLRLVMYQVKRILGKRVEIVASADVQGQVKALAVYKNDVMLKENVKNMREAIKEE